MITLALPPETSWEELLQALKIKYQDKAPYDVLMAQFYGTNMEPEEKCASFGTRLEQKLNQVSLQYPNKISDSMYWNFVRERFFHGLSKNMRTNLRTQFDGGVSYHKLLELARMIESENEDSKTVDKPTNSKGKSKVGAVIVDNTAQQIQQLQGAVKGLSYYRVINRMPKCNKFHNMYLTQCKMTQTLYHRLLKVKALLILQMVEVAIEVEGV